MGSRKSQTEEPKQKGGSLKIIAGWGVIILCVYLLVGLSAQKTTAAQCPDKIDGDANASLHIKYFHQASCPYCWKETPILERLTSQYGKDIAVEHYDTRSCADQVNEYQIRGTPTLVFSNQGQETVVRGFIDEIQIKQRLCSMIGLCS